MSSIPATRLEKREEEEEEGSPQRRRMSIGGRGGKRQRGEGGTGWLADVIGISIFGLRRGKSRRSPSRIYFAGSSPPPLDPSH